ncbi:hypothetical protein CEXT_121581 [Caerostris extrusa]|uniref:Uncharacterized protein n=1 Tax=Caerostris extrusa TaxID=172846 RepID=A0AAV4RL05_CAEEX|nr:hypothetical protein CEXT_121581 [Caerostris extrusa]
MLVALVVLYWRFIAISNENVRSGNPVSLSLQRYAITYSQAVHSSGSQTSDAVAVFEKFFDRSVENFEIARRSASAGFN